MIKYNCAFLVMNKIIIILIVKNLRLFEKMIAFFRLLIEKKYKFMYNITQTKKLRDYFMIQNIKSLILQILIFL